MPAPRKVKIGNEVFESLREAAEFYGTHRHLIAKALKDSDPEKYIQQNFEDHLYMGFDTAKVTNAGKPIKELRLRKAIIRKRVRSYLRYQQTFERQKQQHNAPNAKIRTSKAEYVYDGSGIVVHCGNQDHPERWVSAAQRLQWCGHCRKSVRTLRDGVNAVFEAAGLTILPGQTYKNASTKMKCQCTEGHIALRSRMDVEHRGRRCPTCTGYRGQEVVRDILNKAFKISLEGPDRSLLDGYELDGVDRDARISFEYQGEHHFNKVGYCRTPLRIIRKTDEYKRKEMLRKGYTHIEITELRATKTGFKHDVNRPGFAGHIEV